jgi:hypothetical protein
MTAGPDLPGLDAKVASVLPRASAASEAPPSTGTGQVLRLGLGNPVLNE